MRGSKGDLDTASSVCFFRFIEDKDNPIGHTFEFKASLLEVRSCGDGNKFFFTCDFHKRNLVLHLHIPVLGKLPF